MFWWPYNSSERFHKSIGNLKSNNDYYKQNIVAFASFLKRLVQVFNTWYTQRTYKAQHLWRRLTKKTHNILVKLTQHSFESTETPFNLVQKSSSEIKLIQKWLEVQTHVYIEIGQKTSSKIPSVETSLIIL